MCEKQDTSSLSLPKDVKSCHEMIRSLSQTLAARESDVQRLEATIDRLIRERFGPKRERYADPGQLRLFDGDASCDDSASASGEAPVEEVARKKRRGGTGRRRLDENCRREKRVHRLREDQKCCAKCGASLVIVLVQGAEQWSYRPSEIFGLIHMHEKGFCNCCHDHVVVADKPPQMIQKGAADASLLAHLTTSKQGDHLPLYRYEEISLRSGWWIPRSTQAGWLYQTSLTAVILYAWMASRVLNGRLINTDATGTPVLEPGAGQVQKGTVWVYCGQPEVCPYLIYDYTRTGEGEAARRFLKGYEGYLQADAASVFDRLYLRGSIFEVACAAHMRRYFYKARHSAALEAHRALVYFRQLYLLERELAEVNDDQRRTLRRERALPILVEFKAWLDEQSQVMVPKTEIADAVRYSLNQWDAFVRYCDEGWLLIDNTRSERALRPIAIGRRNWLFFGSDGGGRTGAILYSLVASCKANRVHPYQYLQDVYRRLPEIREDQSLLPLLRAACEQVEVPDGTRPDVDSMHGPLDYLRILKDHRRPLIELLRDETCLDVQVRDELDSLLPDRWLATHPDARLEINRSIRLVGQQVA
jgi:transposase